MEEGADKEKCPNEVGHLAVLGALQEVLLILSN
jgi:hypothetical protein